MSPIKSHNFSFVRYVFVEIIGLFLGTTGMTPEWPKLTQKMTKIPNFADFKRFHAMLVKISIKIVDLNLQNDQQGKNSLPRSLLWRNKCSFSKEKTQNDKKSKNVTTFNVCVQLSSSFRKNSWVRTLYTFKKENVRYPVVICKEMNPVFQKTNASNWHRKTQKLQNFPILKVFTPFGQTLVSLCVEE